jgi:hypothetical protein
MGGKQATELRQGFDRAGRKLDMGKSCIRFRALDDLPLDVIGRIVASTPPAEFIRMYESARSGSAAGAKKSAAGTRSAGGSKKSEAGQRASRKR